MRDYKTIEAWKNVTPEEWNDWQWQVRNRITNIDQLKAVLPLTEQEEDALTDSLGMLRMAVTPYYMSLIDPEDPEDPVRKQAIPTAKETHVSPADLLDPLHEDSDSPVPGLTHRYPDRGILMVTDQCSMYCRHCTRRRKAGETDRAYGRDTIQACIDYIRRTPTFRDVILTGGDPLLVSDEMLDWLLGELRSIPHLEIIRLGTRTPVVMPQRITENLCKIIRKHHPIWVNTHFNHPFEITEASKAACERLADAGAPLGNQSVLLRGVNDDPYIMRELCHQLTRMRVRPYYIYQCDLSTGIEHFRTPVAKGIEIMEYLRGHTSGLAVPTYIVDAPGGGGKIPVMPNYLISMSDKKVILRNYEGVITAYTEPEDRTSKISRKCDVYKEHQRKFSREGLISLFEGDRISIEPAYLGRHERNKHE